MSQSFVHVHGPRISVVVAPATQLSDKAFKAGLAKLIIPSTTGVSMDTICLASFVCSHGAVQRSVKEVSIKAVTECPDDVEACNLKNMAVATLESLCGTLVQINDMQKEFNEVVSHSSNLDFTAIQHKLVTLVSSGISEDVEV